MYLINPDGPIPKGEHLGYARLPMTRLWVARIRNPDGEWGVAPHLWVDAHPEAREVLARLEAGVKDQELAAEIRRHGAALEEIGRLNKAEQERQFWVLMDETVLPLAGLVFWPALPWTAKTAWRAIISGEAAENLKSMGGWAGKIVGEAVGSAVGGVAAGLGFGGLLLAALVAFVLVRR